MAAKYGLVVNWKIAGQQSHSCVAAASLTSPFSFLSKKPETLKQNWPVLCVCVRVRVCVQGFLPENFRKLTLWLTGCNLPLSALLSLPQLRCGEWSLARPQSHGFAGESWVGAPSLLPPEPAQGVLPVPLRLRLRHLAQNHVAQLLCQQWGVSIIIISIIHLSKTGKHAFFCPVKGIVHSKSMHKNAKPFLYF